MRFTPFFLLRLFSSFLFIILYYIAGYRKKVVISNLKICFPEKNINEIHNIAKRFFLHLSDITLESLKGFSMTKNQMLKHYKVLNPEVLNDYFQQKKDIICLASHYGNWEWGILAVPGQVQFSMVALYKELSNKFIEKYLINKRAAMGMNMVSIYDTRTSFESQKEKPTGYIMAADQCPSNVEKAVWINFFKRETACLHGVEYYTMKYKMPIVFFDVRKIRRGYYTLKIKKIEYNSEQYKAGLVTSSYMKMLEEIIKEKPEYWLWSHRRWKHAK